MRATAIDRSIGILSLLLWVPHTISVLYAAYQDNAFDATSAVVTAMWVVGVTALTHITAVHVEQGDWLMLLAFVVGVMSEVSNFGLSGDVHEAEQGLSPWAWVVSSLAYGAIAGALCKAKDIQEGRYFQGYAIAERLYLAVPFTLGQYAGYVAVNGWAGLAKVFMSVILCLSTIGYGAFALQMCQYFGINSDIVGLFDKLVSTSFGVVMSSTIAFGAFTFYLAGPFLNTMLSLNMISSGVGIVAEFAVYDWVRAE